MDEIKNLFEKEIVINQEKHIVIKFDNSYGLSIIPIDYFYGINNLFEVAIIKFTSEINYEVLDTEDAVTRFNDVKELIQISNTVKSYAN